MNETSEPISDEPTGPTYLRVYFISAALIIAGLCTISGRAAVALGIILAPAHAIAIGLISRVKAWRPILLKIWPVTAFVIALLFLLPGRIIFQLATTPEAAFKRLVLSPVPKAVKNIEKKESPGANDWLSLTFDTDRKTIDEVLKSQEYEKSSTDVLSAEMKERMGWIRFDDAEVYQTHFPDSTIRFTAVVNRYSDRMTILYERDAQPASAK